MHMYEQWWLPCTSQWGQRMPLSEHLYCVAIALKMPEQVEQQIYIKFCIQLELSSMEHISVIQRATAMGNWWLAASSQQFTHSCIISCAEIFGETSNHPGDAAPLLYRFGALWLLASPQTKIAFEGEEISDCGWYSGIYDGADWDNCVHTEVHTEGDCVIVLCKMFLESCIFFNKCPYFSYYMTGCLLDRPCM